MRKYILIALLMLSVTPILSIKAQEARYLQECTSGSCKVYFDHGIFIRFRSPGSYIYSRLTKTGGSGGYSTAALNYGGGGDEIGALIDQYSANLYSNGEWVQVHYNNAHAGTTYASVGHGNMSQSSPMYATIE